MLKAGWKAGCNSGNRGPPWRGHEGWRDGRSGEERGKRLYNTEGELGRLGAGLDLA